MIDMIVTMEGRGSVLAMDSEMAGTLKFTFDQSQLPEAIKLALLKGKRIKMHLEEDDQ